jgi:hypothetical protein
MSNTSARIVLFGLTAILLSAGMPLSPAGAQAPAAPAPQVASGPQNPAAQNPPGQAPANPAPNQPPATAPKKKRLLPEIWIGPDVSTYLPSNARTQSRFGSSWFGVGVGLGRPADLKPGGRLEPDFGFMIDAHDENNLFAGLLGVGYRVPIIIGHLKRVPIDDGNVPPGGNAPPGGGRVRMRVVYPPFVPYVRVATHFVAADVHDLADDIHSGVRYGVTGDLYLGGYFKGRAFIEAHYRLMSEIKSFDFSGLGLAIGYRFRF